MPVSVFSRFVKSSGSSVSFAPAAGRPTTTVVPPPRVQRSASAVVSGDPTASKTKSTPSGSSARTASFTSSGAQAARRAEPQRLLAPAFDRIDDEDRARSGDARALDDELADAAGADHERREAGLGPGRVEHCADAGERGAAEQSRLLERNRVPERQRGSCGDDQPLLQARPSRSRDRPSPLRTRSRSGRRAASRGRTRSRAARTPRVDAADRPSTRRTPAPTRARRGLPRPRSSTSEPTSSTTPAPSWPSTIGVGRVHSPL